MIKWSRPSTASHNHSFIPVFSHILRNLKFLYNAFSRRPMFLYIEQEKKPIQHTHCTLYPHHVPTYSARLLATHSIPIFPFPSPPYVTVCLQVPNGLYQPSYQARYRICITRLTIWLRKSNTALHRMFQHPSHTLKDNTDFGNIMPVYPQQKSLDEYNKLYDTRHRQRAVRDILNFLAPVLRKWRMVELVR